MIVPAHTEPARRSSRNSTGSSCRRRAARKRQEPGEPSCGCEAADPFAAPMPNRNHVASSSTRNGSSRVRIGLDLAQVPEVEGDGLHEERGDDEVRTRAARPP